MIDVFVAQELSSRCEIRYYIISYYCCYHFMSYVIVVRTIIRIIAFYSILMYIIILFSYYADVPCQGFCYIIAYYGGIVYSV